MASRGKIVRRTLLGGILLLLAAGIAAPYVQADRFGGRIKGRSEVKVIAGAGHLAELDQPKAVAEAILGWTA